MRGNRLQLQDTIKHLNLSLTVITLTFYMAVFEYQNQVIVNMTISDGEPRCHIDTCFWYPNNSVVFGILKASHFQYDYF